MQRQVYITNRVKTANEQIYYNVDKIHEAIAANKQITFKYFEMNVDKKKVYRKNGDLYTESPVALSWDDENYYLITYKQKYDNYVHYIILSSFRTSEILYIIFSLKSRRFINRKNTRAAKG